MVPTRQQVAAEVIAAFDGLANAQRALGRPKTTIHSWVKNGIPDWRWDEIRAAARRAGIKLPKCAA